jgi:hypothetical protein
LDEKATRHAAHVRTLVDLALPPDQVDGMDHEIGVIQALVRSDATRNGTRAG